MALATISRSPNSCESSLRYGVSPQPAQAPENSNSGSRNWVPRTVPKSTRDRSAAGRVSKNAMLSRSAATSGSRAGEVDRLADRVAGRLDRAGLDAQPAAGAVLDVDLQREAGVGQPDARRAAPTGTRPAPRPAATGRTRCDRITLCGQTKLQLPHWMHRSGSQRGDQLGDVPLLVGRGAARVGAVHRAARSPAGRRRGRPSSRR